MLSGCCSSMSGSRSRLDPARLPGSILMRLKFAVLQVTTKVLLQKQKVSTCRALHLVWPYPILTTAWGLQ